GQRQHSATARDRLTDAGALAPIHDRHPRQPLLTTGWPTPAAAIGGPRPPFRTAYAEARDTEADLVAERVGRPRRPAAVGLPVAHGDVRPRRDLGLPRNPAAGISLDQG